MNITDLHTLFLNASGVSTDSRKIAHNTIFFALKGDNFNGNRYALEALKKGASYAVVDENVDHSNVRLIQVDNVLHTLQELATFHRKYLNIPVLALTGSNGKTTTKELIKAVLSAKYKVKATVGNLNNHIGVPLTMLSFDHSTAFGIVEMGANHQKEIATLCNIAYPDYGLITNYGKAHLEGFGGVEGVIKGKSEMYQHLIQHHKTIFYNSCDPIQQEKLKDYKNTYAFGHCDGADFPTKYLSSDPYVKFMAGSTTVNTQLTGGYNYNNLALAAAIGHFFEIDAEAVREALEAYSPDNNRSQIINKGRTQILLDAYNANPSSMEAALKHFATSHPGKTKMVILGDMFELGDAAADEHQKITSLCKELDLEEVILVGKNFKACTTPYPQVASYEDLKAYLKAHPVATEQLLIKGSRGMALERVLDLI
ncbi:UDP-N-acetylmuramoyl-tripeptide--D-alanyl-D-alanine ligase [Robertkochia flava]|uniref:UDP-N-acetylmuramoyl-tripeptide--D-alanyl-D- alanine ligase n=1 Tax=Robertkochia flava TaxID=3447986 RepID=UPI001CCB81EF|nr:UDP-N-acetylmuramoyl-tripeptide--D-alanyl-D-alanine ligase [Robertkochia marina]